MESLGLGHVVGGEERRKRGKRRGLWFEKKKMSGQGQCPAISKKN